MLNRNELLDPVLDLYPNLQICSPASVLVSFSNFLLPYYTLPLDPIPPVLRFEPGVDPVARRVR